MPHSNENSEGSRTVLMTSGRWLVRRLVFAATRRQLSSRLLVDADGQESRWLRPEVDEFLKCTDEEANALRPYAKLGSIPTFGNRLLVELAIFTVACDRSLRNKGLSGECARQVIADIGWEVYRRMLSIASFPVRTLSRDPGKRLNWTLRLLLRFPFSAPGAPGYEVETRVNGDEFLTHFTHCPPQSFVRRIAEELDDPEALKTFQNSWCRYDWPAADIIAADGERGHYRRTRTLSHGDSVCDMCWKAHAQKCGE